jgi:hypothetical protein
MKPKTESQAAAAELRALEARGFYVRRAQDDDGEFYVFPEGVKKEAAHVPKKTVRHLMTKEEMQIHVGTAR